MGATPADLNLDLLREFLASTERLAKRFAWSVGRVQSFMPMDAVKVETMSEEDEEKLDAYLLRFNQLTAMLQDHITRSILRAEEELMREMSRKDQRSLMEKLGALRPSLEFGSIAELRNKIAHTYPNESEKQAEILNEVFNYSGNLLEGFNSIVAYADQKHFTGKLGIEPVPIPG
jgi:hypothetical protein